MQGLPGVQRSRLRQHDAGSRLESARQRRERQLARVAALEPEHGHDRAEHARGHVARAARADVFPARDRGAHRSLRAQFNPSDDIRDYNACAAAAAAQTGIAASFGDGLDARVFPHGCALSKQYGGIVLPVINPLSMDTIRANLDLANAAQPFAVSVVIDSAGLPHLKAASPDAGSKTVAELRELCDYAQMPMILKGIMTVRGAEKAVEAGAAAIVVSNHGGRVLPGAAATADVLPEIADAVGDRVKILVDGGIRSGTDIFRALALGADAVMICRPFLISYYGGGTEGIVAYVEKLRAELTDAMYMCGARSLGEITRDMVRAAR